MTDERSTFETTKARLEDIVTQVRRKDVSLEASLDLLEEAVRLVNQCNDLIDQTSWKSSQSGGATGEESSGDVEPTPAADVDTAAEAPGGPDVAVEPAGPDDEEPGPAGEQPAEAPEVEEIEDDARE